MVEASNVATILITIIIPIIAIRLAFFRRRILELQAHMKTEIDGINSDFESILTSRRRADRDPVRALNTAERLFARKRLLTRLYGFYRNNKTFEAIGGVAVGLLIPFAISGYDLFINDLNNLIFQLHSLTAGYFAITTIGLFIIDLRNINGYEKRFGIGEQRSTH